MTTVRAIVTIVLYQLKTSIGLGDTVLLLIRGIPTTVLLGWIAKESGSPGVLAYMSFGAAFMILWTDAVLRMGFSLLRESSQGTMQLNLLSQTSLTVIMFAKSTALTIRACIPAMIAFVTVQIVYLEGIQVTNVFSLMASVSVSVFAIITGGFVFAPLIVVMGGRPGIFNAIRPLVVILSGFVYPVAYLPGWIQVLAAGTPTSWAMRAMYHSLEFQYSLIAVARNCVFAITVSLIYLAITFILFRTVERRIRITGTLNIA